MLKTSERRNEILQIYIISSMFRSGRIFHRIFAITRFLDRNRNRIFSQSLVVIDDIFCSYAWYSLKTVQFIFKVLYIVVTFEFSVGSYLKECIFTLYNVVCVRRNIQQVKNNKSKYKKKHIINNIKYPEII